MQTFIKTCLLFLFLTISTLPSLTAQSKAEQIEKLLDQYAAYDQFIGSVLVAENGKVIFKKGYGMANMEWGMANQANTKHLIGSITKQFTAMLIMQLVEQGKLDLTVPISTYLPNYPKDKGDQITLHHLMTHTAGIPNYTSFPDFMEKHSRTPYIPADLIKVFADSTLLFKPGAEFSYSNSGYVLLGYIIEKTTGKSYEQVLQEQILRPLNMKNTGYNHHESIMKNRAAGYQSVGGQFVNAIYIDMSIPYAAGSMYSTVEDLYLWDQALHGNELLSEKNKSLMFGHHIPARDGHYGYGFEMRDMPLGESKDMVATINHGGSVPGFNAQFTRIPKEKNLVVMCSNAGNPDFEGISMAISAILYGKPYAMPKRSLAKLLLETIQSEGLQAGMSAYEKYKNNAEYTLVERDVNIAGYTLLRDNKLTEAIAVFQLNVAEFPKSGNVYDSLGEAYLADGQRALAIENYKKSVAVDPTNENGKMILKELEKE